MFLSLIVALWLQLSLEDFWARLRETELLLQAGQISDINALWAEVDAVQLADGTVITVEMGWLQLDENSDLAQKTHQVQAILKQTDRPLYEVLTLAALEEVRMEYDEEEPPPDVDLPQASVPVSGNEVSALSFLVQVVLIIVAAVAITGLIFYLTNQLLKQPPRANVDVEDDIPPNAEVAQDRASLAAAAGDYRAAIRYLYLASLLSLDERDLLHFDPSLTNYEHLRQIKDNPRLLNRLTPIVNVFDHVWYGFAPVTDAQFQTFRQWVEELQGMEHG